MDATYVNWLKLAHWAHCIADQVPVQLWQKIPNQFKDFYEFGGYHYVVKRRRSDRQRRLLQLYTELGPELYARQTRGQSMELQNMATEKASLYNIKVRIGEIEAMNEEVKIEIEDQVSEPPCAN